MRGSRSRPVAGIRVDDDAGRRGLIFAGRATDFSSRARRSPISHDFAALVFCVSGQSRIELRSTWTLRAGDVLIVPAGEPHRSVGSGGSDVWHLGFCLRCLATETSPSLLAVFERVRDGASPVASIPADRHAFLETLFRELSGDSKDDLVRESLLNLILSEVKRATESSNDITSDTSLVAETLRYIERHCLDPLTLNEIATAMKRTPSYITTALTRATGRSAVAWIIAGRMAEARRRLLHSDERVDIIAERVGYADATHFIRLFRRTHGATPAAWRAMHRPSSLPVPSSTRDSPVLRRSIRKPRR